MKTIFVSILISVFSTNSFSKVLDNYKQDSAKAQLRISCSDRGEDFALHLDNIEFTVQSKYGKKKKLKFNCPFEVIDNNIFFVNSVLASAPDDIKLSPEDGYYKVGQIEDGNFSSKEYIENHPRFSHFLQECQKSDKISYFTTEEISFSLNEDTELQRRSYKEHSCSYMAYDVYDAFLDFTGTKRRVQYDTLSIQGSKLLETNPSGANTPCVSLKSVTDGVLGTIATPFVLAFDILKLLHRLTH